MVNTYRTHVSSLTAPPAHAQAVTPSDSADLPFVSRAIYAGTAGDVRLLTLEGEDVTYRGLQGTKIIRAKKIFATGTTAADIVIEW